MRPSRQVDLIEESPRARNRGTATNASRAHRHHHVLERAQAGDEVEGLEHDADRPPSVLDERPSLEGCDVDVAEANPSVLRREDPTE